MLSCLFFLFGRSDDLAELDAIARARDVKAVMAHAGPGLKEADFSFLTRPGAFGTGRTGWHAYPLNDPAGGKTYVVFGTSLTTQDYGEFVFEYSGGKLVRLQDEREMRGYKVGHLDFDLRFAPEQKRAEVVATVSLSRIPGAEPSVHLRMSPNYKVSKVTDEKGSALRFAQASGVVSVEPPPGERPVIKLTYGGVVDQPQFAGAITRDEVMLTNDYWWPSIGRQPATVTTSATVPANWIVVTHGNKVSDVVQGETRKVKYQMDVPISYLSLSAGPFKDEQKKVGRITYHVWSRRMSQEDMALQLELMPPVIEFYERFAPYPFTDFGAMVTELYGGGALEAYSFATYGTGWLPDEDTHEPAHTWWGGIVSNTYLNSYWNESFANFAGGMFQREVAIGNTNERRHAFVSQSEVGRDYARIAVADAGAFQGGIASTMGYGKGGEVLQQLEYEIGTPKMVEAMKTWIADNPKGVSGEWSGFEKAVAKVTGQDMDWFFKPWLHTAGAPQFEITALGYEGGAVRGQVDFKGVPYRIKCQVYVEMSDGTNTLTDVVLNPQSKLGVSEFSFVLPKKPVFVSFDPYDRILRERGPAPQMRLANRLGRLQLVVDPAHREYAATFSGFNNRPSESSPGADPSGKFFVGHPDSLPVMRDLCRKAGFTVNGDKLTYDGTTIDLKHGAAMALVDLGGGRVCAIGLGVTRREPSAGISSMCLVDDLGRFLRGRTEPRREGATVFRIP